MIKKLILGGGIVLVLVVLFVGWDVASYVRTSAGYVSEAVRDSVPMEFQIDRARGMIKGLEPDIRKNLHEIAKAQVDVERLEKQIAETEASLAKAREHIMQLRDDLDSGQEVFTYGKRTFTAEQVKTDLAHRFNRYKTAKATLDMQRQIHQARQSSLEHARQQLDATLAERRDLHVKVENLEARMKMVAAMQTTSDYNFDDSRLDVEEMLVDVEGHFQGQIPLDEPAPANVVEEVTEYFGDQEPAVEALAQQ